MMSAAWPSTPDRWLFARAAARLALAVELPEGVRHGTGPRIVLRRPDAFFHRVGTDGLSEEQAALAAERVAAAGHAAGVSIELRDYREVDRAHDAIVSVEMIEAVGERYLAGVLPGPRPPAGTRRPVSSCRRSRCRTTGCSPPATPTPGCRSTSSPVACCPRFETLQEAMSATSLRLAGQSAIGHDYARTLRLWRERFESADIETLGFDAAFRRMWQFYRTYSEAGFGSGYLNVRHLLLERSP